MINATASFGQSYTTIKNDKLDSLLLSCADYKNNFYEQAGINKQLKLKIYNLTEQVSLYEDIQSNNDSIIYHSRNLNKELNGLIIEQEKVRKRQKLTSFLKGSAVGITISGLIFLFAG